MPRFAKCRTAISCAVPAGAAFGASRSLPGARARDWRSCRAVIRGATGAFFGPTGPVRCSYHVPVRRLARQMVIGRAVTARPLASRVNRSEVLSYAADVHSSSRPGGFCVLQPVRVVPRVRPARSLGLSFCVLAPRRYETAVLDSAPGTLRAVKFWFRHSAGAK